MSPFGRGAELPEAEGACLGVIVHVLRGRGAEAEFLFLERSGGRFEGQWWPVAGTVESGEDPVATALREMGEEISLTPDTLYTTGRTVQHPEASGHLQLFLAFVEARAEVTLNHEHSDHVWLGVEEAAAFVPETVEDVIRTLEARFLAAPPPAAWILWRRPPA